jgi:hypothetical protein
VLRRRTSPFRPFVKFRGRASATSALGHSLQGRPSGKSGHVRCDAESGRPTTSKVGGVSRHGTSVPPFSASAIRPLRTNKKGRPAPLPTAARALTRSGCAGRSTAGDVRAPTSKQRPLHDSCPVSRLFQAYGKLTCNSAARRPPVRTRQAALDPSQIPRELSAGLG